MSVRRQSADYGMSQVLSWPWQRNTIFPYSFILEPRTTISFEYYVRKDLARRAAKPLVVEVVSFTVSRDQLRMQMTMCVLDYAFTIHSPTRLNGIFSDQNGISYWVRSPTSIHLSH